ncbi:hypothetical protein D5S17_33730 [Pseudonocardiaceae bacterium YIM PH 21723]|nr:hypothetical protein D5S17_33730 [Pseudonocardiaceae bacterium YIM PH 21723]
MRIGTRSALLALGMSFAFGGHAMAGIGDTVQVNENHKNDLRPVRTQELPDGKIVRYQQYFDDVPVFAGEETRFVDGTGAESVGVSKLSAKANGHFPADLRAAEQKATRAVHGGHVKEVQAYWYDESLWETPGAEGAVPAFLVKQESGQWTIVSATDNSVLKTWRQFPQS